MKFILISGKALSWDCVTTISRKPNINRLEVEYRIAVDTYISVVTQDADDVERLWKEILNHLGIEDDPELLEVVL